MPRNCFKNFMGAIDLGKQAKPMIYSMSTEE